jgi:23S rRNA pseudouridine1911/1915/1917 synthase
VTLSGDKQDIPVLYEDNHVLVVVKPVNMPTQEDESHDRDLLTTLKENIKRRYHKPGNVFLGLVHRLDRPVGGVMVFAKTSKAASRLSDAVRTRSLDKRYLAVARGHLPAREGRLTDTLLKNRQTNTVRVVPPGTPGAKEAVLDYQVLESRQGLHLLLVHLHTGRSHQIRVQLAGAGAPLYGDQKYGGSLSRPGEQLALWAFRLAFPHPVSKQIMGFRALPPDTFPWNVWGCPSRLSEGE